MKAPAFQWYPKDCDTDEKVRAMDDAEFGFYVRCLNHAWMNDGIPEDFSEFSRVIGRKKSYIVKMWSRVGRCFFLENGRYRNERQERQRKEQQQFADKRKKAAATRWNASAMHVHSKKHASAMHVQCSASASANTYTEHTSPVRGDSEPKCSVSEQTVNFDFGERFQRLWTPYHPKGRTKRIEAEHIFVNLFMPMSDEQRESEFEQAEASLLPGGKWQRSKVFAEGKYVSWFGNFLLNKRWHEDPEPAKCGLRDEDDPGFIPRYIPPPLVRDEDQEAGAYGDR